MNYDLGKLDFKIAGEGRPVLLLHGWGRDKDAFDPVTKYLKGYKFLSYSMPGFGNSPEPAEPWSAEDYAELTNAFLDAHLTPTERRHLLCVTHSYGGRIASYVRDFEKLVLIAAAGIKPKRPPKAQIGLILYKTLKFFASIPVLGVLFKKPHAAYRAIRSSDDYKRATPVMQRALSMAVNTDLRKEYAKLKCPTLLIWGRDDDVTPLWMGREIQKLAKDTGIVLYDDCGHQVLYQKPEEVATVIDNFFKDGAEDTVLAEPSITTETSAVLAEPSITTETSEVKETVRKATKAPKQNSAYISVLERYTDKKTGYKSEREA